MSESENQASAEIYNGRGQVPAGPLIKNTFWAILGVALLIGTRYLPSSALNMFGHSVSIVWLAIALVPLVGGLLMIAYHFILHKNAKYHITADRIQIERGIVARNIELIELYKIIDIGLSSIFGRGVITIFSSDQTAPKILISIPNARSVFDQIQQALPEARARSKVAMRLDISN